MGHEEALIRAFIKADRRPRLLELRSTLKGRAKLCASLAHFQNLDLRYAQLLPATKHAPRDIEELLRKKGAPETCHILSESSELDGQEMPLKSALEKLVGAGMGSFLSCIPGRLGYFESEERGERYVLERAV